MVVVVTGVGGVVISGGVVEEGPPALSPAISGRTLIGLEGHVEQCAVRTDFIDLGSVLERLDGVGPVDNRPSTD